MKPTLIFETTQSTPKAELLHFEAELAGEENWNVIQQGLEARLVEHPDGKGGACAAWECPSLGTPTNGGKDVAVLLAHLGLRLPSRSKTVQNVVEKNH